MRKGEQMPRKIGRRQDAKPQKTARGGSPRSKAPPPSLDDKIGPDDGPGFDDDPADLDDDDGENDKDSKDSEAGSSKPAPADAQQAEDEKAKYPYLHMTFQPGSILLGTADREVARPMTGDDYAECIEDGIALAEKARGLESVRDDLLAEEKRTKEHLDSVREQYRNTRDKLAELASQTWELNLAARDNVRKRPTKVNISITSTCEYIEQDAHDGAVIERRTATADELAESKKVKSGSLFSVPTDAPGLVAQQKTSDSPDAKPDIGEERVLVSVDLDAYNKAKRSAKKDLRTGPRGDEDDDGWNLTWAQRPELTPNRMYADVPRRILQDLRTLTEGTTGLDFRIETPSKD